MRFNKKNNLSAPRYQNKKLLYPLLVSILYLTWFIYMQKNDAWHIFRDYWQAAVTMIFGSFVAGSTAEGGAFVAFPVFTKLLKISSADASTFGLMIQSIGMSFASIFILLYRIPVLYNVIFWSSLGGIGGMILGINWIHLDDPLPKVLFTTIVFSFAIILAFNRWVLNWKTFNTINQLNGKKMAFFLLFGIIGGIVSAKIGIGINIIIFIVLTLAFGINEKIATPTSVIIMAIISISGFALHGLNGSINHVVNYWLTAVPIVCLGAPLGAYVGSKLSRDQVILFLLILILIESISTVLLIPLTNEIIYFSLTIGITSLIIFSLMIYYRYQQTMIQSKNQ